MPCKNAARYLDVCLGSIRKQSYQNWELLVVDDHSTDNSLKILFDYAQEDQRIKVFSSKGTGIIQALRTGYSQSSGTYITRMDADDKMSSDKILSMQTALDEFGSGGLAVGCVEYFSEGELGDGYKQYAAWLNDLTIAQRNFDDIYKECSVPSPCWMCSKEDFDSCGGFQVDVYPEDYDLAFRFRAGGLQVLGLAGILHYWRDYPNRTSRTDDNYADNRFLELKVSHFIQEDQDVSRPLVLWGAGNKGKKIARLLQANGIEYKWICNNPKKIGQNVYDVIIEDLSVLQDKKSVQVIVAFVDPDNQSNFSRICLDNNHHQYYRFC